METISADASPEKRFFVSLITRDISLVAAFLDLIDNSLNAAIERFAARLKTAKDYQDFFADNKIKPSVNIDLTVNENEVVISDNANGISAEVASKHVFKFGRSTNEIHENDRLSVYGIGLKRAIFKMGNKIDIVSECIEGGFSLDLDVKTWLKDNRSPWSFSISKREAAQRGHTGTKIRVTGLNESVKSRINTGTFFPDLKSAISRTYAFYISKIVKITVNGEEIISELPELSDNYSSKSFETGAVTYAISAGITKPAADGRFKDPSSGWFVFCNGRVVLSGDKTSLTGWGGGLPIFQPKHRPFAGYVYFVSQNAEALPWTTTKASIDQDNGIWQEAKLHMFALAKQVINFLDNRYTDTGVEVTATELVGSAIRTVSVLSASSGEQKIFHAPPAKKIDTVRIQYDASKKDVKKVAEHLGNPSLGGSEVGRRTFMHFLENEVGD